MSNSFGFNARLAIAVFAMFSLLGFLPSSVFAQDKEKGRSRSEFIDYVKSRLSGIDDAKLERLFKAVDTDGDGRVSDAEFAKRMDALRKVQSGPAPGKAKRPDQQKRLERDLKDKQGDFERYSRRAAPPDKFPVFDNPKMTDADDSTIDADEFVIGVVIGGEAKAYPIAVMGKHELGNDVIGKTHITVSW